MPTRITNFLHDSIQTGAQVLGTAFDVNDVHVHDMTEGLPDFQRTGRNFYGIVEGIHIRLTSATSPTKVTIRLCADASGDLGRIPDTEADLVAGITTDSSKCAASPVRLPTSQLPTRPAHRPL